MRKTIEKFYKSKQKSHVLNDKFYQELLYIMGLKESKRNGKAVILIDTQRENSFAKQVYQKYIEEKKEKEEIAFEKTFELILIWMNRLLFIKLFEGQLMAIHSNQSCYCILDSDKIESFQNLWDLFFNVLGKKDRTQSEFLDKFSKIPYLNSSLFEQQEIEKRDININDLKNDPLEMKKDSVLFMEKRCATIGKYPSGIPLCTKRCAIMRKELPLLQYIIAFLNCYDFAPYAYKKGVTAHGRDSIDASVLGLIFEKINGYKDGSFYTPSEITEFMAKEALERTVRIKINQTMHWNCETMEDLKFKIASSKSIGLSKKLNGIINSTRICDVAVGSGHFLVSALNRLIAIKAELGILFIHGTNTPLRDYEIFVKEDTLVVRNAGGEDFIYDKNNFASQQVQETLFAEKKTIIENCLFGVDLNAKAVSICQLRLWIELLKSAYYKEGITEILPNIDTNIKVGNSLVSRLYFEIGKRVGGKEACHNKDQLYKNAMEWAVEFPEIISEDGVFLGFDCIIGNPPYIQLQSMHKEADKLKKMGYDTYTKTGDIYCLFYELGYRLLKKNGILSYITSNKWMKASYGEKLREFFLSRTDICQLIDFTGTKLFDLAAVDVTILMFEKNAYQKKTSVCIAKKECLENLSVFVQQNSFLNEFQQGMPWVIFNPIEKSIKEKIEAVGKPLKEWEIDIYRGILTGYNEAFIIDGETRKRLIEEDKNSAKLIRPILRGRDIKRYAYDFADKWIIVSHNGIKKKNIPRVDINDYPAVKNHLDQFYDKLSKRTDKGETPYNLRNCIYMDDFSKQKIVYREISNAMNACMVESDIYLNNKCYLITGNHLIYLLSILNSILFHNIFFKNVNATGGKGRDFLENIALPLPAQEMESALENLYYARLRCKDKREVLEIEEETENLIYKMYSLSLSEIKTLKKM